MAALPSQHPHLALHLTDRALTPIISSATTPSSSSSRNNNSSSSQQDQEQRLASLASLSSTALTSYDAAKRLEMGAPLRTMVEHPDAGPVVLHSYLCPMGLALGTPGRNASSTSLQTMLAGPDVIVNNNNNNNGGPEGSAPLAAPATTTTTRRRSAGTSTTYDTETDYDDGGASDATEGPNAPPMLVGIVVAPAAEELKDARRAAGRLERIARRFQTEWVAENNNEPGGSS